MSTTVIRKACARFPGFVLRAVTPFCLPYFRGLPGPPPSKSMVFNKFLKDFGPAVYPGSRLGLGAPGPGIPKNSRRIPRDFPSSGGVPGVSGGAPGSIPGHPWEQGERSRLPFQAIYTYSRSTAPAAVTCIDMI